MAGLDVFCNHTVLTKKIWGSNITNPSAGKALFMLTFFQQTKWRWCYPKVKAHDDHNDSFKLWSEAYNVHTCSIISLPGVSITMKCPTSNKEGTNGNDNDNNNNNDKNHHVKVPMK